MTQEQFKRAKEIVSELHVLDMEKKNISAYFETATESPFGQKSQILPDTQRRIMAFVCNEVDHDLDGRIAKLQQEFAEL